MIKTSGSLCGVDVGLLTRYGPGTPRKRVQTPNGIDEMCRPIHGGQVVDDPRQSDHQVAVLGSVSQ